MKINFSVVYHDGAAKFQGLNMYYGADSLGGLAEAVALTTHAIINNNIVKQTPAVKAFNLDFKESHEGSYKQNFVLEFTDGESVRVLEHLKVGGFMELLGFHLASPLGLRPKIESEVANRWFRSYMDDSEELLDRLERPLARIHHPVSGLGYQVTVFKSRTKFLSFNERTLDYLSATEINEDREFLDVAVSRFNARTCTGRFIESEDAESISFSPLKAGIGQKAKSLLANSLRDLAEEKMTKVRVEVRRVLSRDDRTKHLILQSVHEI